jgi:AcrR family transcriptional regulator
MSVRAPYRTRKRNTDRAAATRARIIASVRELLSQGRFHDCTVEQVAEHAGVSRATLYLHFRSRVELVDAICDVMGENPELVGIRESVRLTDPDAALAETIAGSVRFWASEDSVLAELYGVVAIDPGAKDFVDRQRRDRRSEMELLAHNLRRAGRLRSGLSEKRALAQLMLLTSYDTVRELAEAGLSGREATTLLQANARDLLLA